MKHLLTLALAASLPATAALHGQTLLLHWNFDEASSGTSDTIDYGSAPQVDGRFFTSATRTGETPAGFSLGAADVTALATSSVLANPTDLAGKLNNLTTFTFSLWVNMQSSPANLDRIFRAGNNTGFGIRVVTPPSGTISASNFGLTLDLVGGAVPMNVSVNADNSWLFLAFTFDASLPADNVRLYVGTDSTGVSLASTATASIVNTGVLDANLTLGRHPSLSNRGVPAYLDDFRIYSGVGDAAFIEDLRLANIPEPRTYALLMGLLGGTLIWIRRRRA
jgi:hypothetical protein